MLSSRVPAGSEVMRLLRQGRRRQRSRRKTLTSHTASGSDKRDKRCIHTRFRGGGAPAGLLRRQREAERQTATSARDSIRLKTLTRHIASGSNRYRKAPILRTFYQRFDPVPVKLSILHSDTEVVTLLTTFHSFHVINNPQSVSNDSRFDSID